MHTCVVKIDDEVVVRGFKVQPHSAGAGAGDRQRGRVSPQVLVFVDSVDAFIVLALRGELAVEAGLDKHAVMVDRYHVRSVGSDEVT